MARFCPLFSGSSGNCLYVGTSTDGVLIDAGVSARRMERALLDRQIDPRTISAIFVTHEHRDHIAGLRVFQKKYGIPVYASVGTKLGIQEADALADCDDCHPITDAIELDSFRVESFSTSHDSRECTGFRMSLRDGRTVGIVTDLGVVTVAVREKLSGCDFVHIESNHDVRMLENGRYPYVLKRRILSATGHLSNELCAAELPALLRSGTTRFVLGHLSCENNLPELAQATAVAALTSCGALRDVDYLLETAPAENDRPYTIF